MHLRSRSANGRLRCSRRARSGSWSHATGDLVGQLASTAGPRSPACPKCGVHSLNAVRRRRKPRTMNSRCGTVHIPRVRLTCRACGHSWLPLQAALGVGAQQRTSGGLQHWEALVGGLTIFAEAAQLLETLAGVQVGTETLRTHAEAAGTELEGEQRAAMAQVQATQEPPPGYAPVVEALVVETDGGDGTLSGSPSGWHSN